jgi:glucokinase
LILAGDIGGTKTVLALTGPEPGGILSSEQRFASRDFKSLKDVIEVYLKGREVRPERACFAVAGPVVNGRSQTTNLPWVIDAKELSETFSISRVWLLNDLEATAHGILHLKEKDFGVLNPGHPVPSGNRAVIAAGTGLGEALMFWDGQRYHPSATEGGHTDFAPRNAVEIRLLEFLLSRLGRVSYERVLSGPGLENLYRFFSESDGGAEPEWLSRRLEQEDPGAVIADAALSGKSESCVKALNLFVSLYGAEAGNLALKGLALAGVYIGGGIAPKILGKLLDGEFMKAFIDKGRYASLMNRIPVRVILDPDAALLGAARFAQSHGMEER